ncbi:hypothetical protein L6452_42288 [Arctium lappa]|uniref:Uncharacterized protein n=1 Tax=Arctium lappa TaxID=4217 RepID=A0ACB8XIC4_ARCLA|nr:hypothetical protein L6452_42288 [Arctium lappa]
MVVAGREDSRKEEGWGSTDRNSDRSTPLLLCSSSSSQLYPLFQFSARTNFSSQKWDKNGPKSLKPIPVIIRSKSLSFVPSGSSKSVLLRLSNQEAYPAYPQEDYPAPATTIPTLATGPALAYPPSHRPQNKFDRRYSTIANSYNSLEQVNEALAHAGLESSNLILGIKFTKSNE